MAASPLARPLRLIPRYALRAGAWFALLLGLLTALYLLSAWIGSAIPRNSDWHEPTMGIEIMVETNGSHTGIVMPIRTPAKDWRATFPQLNALTGGRATHIAVGWGEREVFLRVGTWADLDARTVLRILGTGGASVMRVTPYIRPAPDAYHRPLRITPGQYARLVRRIEASLAPLPPGSRAVRRTLAGTDRLSLYYDARGRYTMLETCNSWTGQVLGDAGVRIGHWTPLAGGVMKWIEAP